MKQHEVPAELREEWRKVIERVLKLRQTITEKQAQLFVHGVELEHASTTMSLVLRLLCQTMQIEVKDYKFSDDGRYLLED